MVTETKPKAANAEVVELERKLEAAKKAQQAAMTAGDIQKVVALGMEIMDIEGGQAGGKTFRGRINALRNKQLQEAFEAKATERDALRVEFEKTLGPLFPQLEKLRESGFTGFNVVFSQTGDVPAISWKVPGASKGTGGTRAPRSSVTHQSLEPGKHLTGEYKPRNGDPVKYDVEVLSTGKLRYKGTEYGSVSGVAKAITGVSTNGYKFFNLT